MLSQDNYKCQEFILSNNSNDISQKSALVDYLYNTPLPDGVQVDLADLSQKDTKWDMHRTTTMITEQVLFADLDFLKVAQRVKDCSGTLLFGFSGGDLKLKQAWFCRFRHCPVCTWRKSLLLKALAFQRMPEIVTANPKHRFLFLTLTVKNCDIHDLKSEIAMMNKAWKRLSQRKEFTDYVDGWVRTTEVTRNPKDNTAHPHYHVILMVKPSYFAKGYIKHEKWRELWQHALRADYLPMINIKPIKAQKLDEVLDSKAMDLTNSQLDKGMILALCETLKYGVKVDDILGDGEDNEANEWFRELCRQTHNNRFLASSGLLAGILKKDKNRPDDDFANDDLLLLDNDDGDQKDTPKDDKRLAFSFARTKKRYVYNPKFNQ